MGPTPAAWGAIAALAVFALTATFYAGYLTARVRAIEEWRLEVRADLLQIERTLRRIAVKLQVEEY